MVKKSREAGATMKTLIELFDERPIENVLATEVFRPERTVYLCPAEVAQDSCLHQKLKDYFIHRGLSTEPVFVPSALYRSDKVLAQLRTILKTYDDCALDITGGTDAALFACGLLCAGQSVPTFTYARRTNRFYNIHNAPFADNLPCTIRHTVEDCILMAGGSMHPGRVDNGSLSRYTDFITPFFQVYLRYRTLWTQTVHYFQWVSRNESGRKPPLKISAKQTVTAERGAKLSISVDCLRDLAAIGFLLDLKAENETVRFSFRDSQVRTWLRDNGSVLELYVYQACLDTGIFNDVRSSVVVNWEGCRSNGDVVNEIDVMAMQGVLPAFISCKTCEINTEALNELEILRDRFGGKSAKAAIVTSKVCSSETRHRAAELGIDVIDLNDLKAGRIKEHLRAMMRKD